MRARALLLAGAAIALAGPALAQTAIVPDAPNSGFGTGTTLAQNGAVTTIDGGRQAGSNLFHSFSRFDLGAGDTARWTSAKADSILNVISRVTGGTASHLDGTIDSTALPRADFWFINPAGIVLGDGAQVNVPGAAHFSTAHELIHADGTRFSTVTQDGSTLSIAAPQAFGFLGGQGDIALSGTIDAGTTSISLSARNIDASGATIGAGALTFAALGDQAASFDPLHPPGIGLSGQIVLDSTSATTFPGKADGHVTLLAGAIGIFGSAIDTTTSSDADAGAISLFADQIDITGTTLDAGTFAAGDSGPIEIGGSSAKISGSSIFSDSFGADASGNSRTIIVNVGALDLRDTLVSARSSGTGAPGLISFQADTIAIDNGTINSDAGEDASGQSGYIELVGRKIAVTGGSSIESRTAGVLDGGLISISADGSLTIDAASINSNAEQRASGVGGFITLDAPALQITRGSTLESSTSGSGDAGNIIVSGDDVIIASSTIKTNAGLHSTGNGGLVSLSGARALSLFDSRVEATTRSIGDSGLVLVNATGDLALVNSTIASNASPSSQGAALGVLVESRTVSMDGSHITSDSFGDGAAGLISITTDQLAMTGDGAEISTDALSNGAAGHIIVNTGDLSMESDSSISSSTFANATGDFGNIDITASAIALLDDARIQANSRGASDGGDITVNTGSLFLSGGAITSNAAATASGRAGGISVTASVIEVRNSGFIASDTRGSGNAGNIKVRADGLKIADNGRISSDSLGCLYGECAASAGSVDIAVGTLDLLDGGSISTDTNGPGFGGGINVVADAARLLDGRISADTVGCVDLCTGGPAGAIFVAAGSLLLSGPFASISSDTTGSGDAGNVTVKGNRVGMEDSSRISSNSRSSFDAGNAGTISIDAGLLALDTGARISSETDNSGNAGAIAVTADTVTLRGGSAISSDNDALSSGTAGTVTIDAGTLTLDNASISSDSFGAGDSGGVVVTVGTLTLKNGSFIATDALGCSDGSCAAFAGTVDIDASSIDLSGGSFVSTDTSGPGDGGDVMIRTQSLNLTGNSYVSSDSLGCAFDCVGGFGGSVDIIAKSVTVADATISSDTFGTGDAGSLTIKADAITITGRGAISSATKSFATGNSGSIEVMAGWLVLKGGQLTTQTAGDGQAGAITIDAGRIESTGGSIRSDSTGSGPAGFVFIDAKTVDLTAGSKITSASSKGDGIAGVVSITADSVRVQGGSQITTSSVNATPGQFADVVIVAPQLLIAGSGSAISTDSQRLSANPADPANQAGGVFLKATSLRIADGGLVTSSSLSGAAGSVSIFMPDNGILRLEGATAPGVIRTSSGPGTGGMITIDRPLAIISNGGSILAQGQQRGALAVLKSEYFINSFDRQNLVAVDGPIAVDASIYDVSAGTTTPTVNFLDASRVLSGQCAAARASGQTSQLSARPLGPYLRQGASLGGGAIVTGGCL